MNEERLHFLVMLSDRLRPLRDPVEIQDVAARLLGEHLRVNRVVYATFDGNEFTITRSHHIGVGPFTASGAGAALGELLLEAYKRGETVAVDDVAADQRLTDAERSTLSASEVAAFVLVSLIKAGQLVAAFGVHSSTPRIWTRDQIALIEATGERTWAADARARAEDALRQSKERHGFLLQLTDALRSLSDPADVQETAARLLGEHLGVNRVGYAEMGANGYVIRCEYARGVGPLVGHGPSGTFGTALSDAYRRGDTVVVNNVSTDPRFTESERVTMERRQIAAFIGATLVKNGRFLAAFGANNATPRDWTPTEIALVRDVAERTWDAVERTRAEAALREREQRLHLALDASAAGVWTWDAQTNRLDWDDRVHAHYGLLPGGPRSLETWISALHNDDRQRVLDRLGHVLRCAEDNEWNETFRIVRPDGTERWMQGFGRAERDADGRVMRIGGICLDITDRRRAEEALQARRDEEHNRELRLLLETATQGIVFMDAHGTILTANHALETMFGWGPGELIGHSIERLVPMERGVDLVGRRKDGSTFPIEVSLNEMDTPRGGRAIAFVTDITERQQAAAALQERTAELEHRTAQLSRLASDLTLAEHHAREQLARTLHDGLQQMLLVAAVNLDQQLRRNEQRGIASDDLVVQAKRGLDEAVAAARSLSIELYPPVLQSSGLPAALTWLADQTRKKYGLDVQVSADRRADSTRKDIRTLLFESVRELLVNAVKHAQVEWVSVDLALDADNALCITVTDRGVGFDPAALIDRMKTGSVGWGLFSIRERLTLLGGRLEIQSAPGQGTVFRLIAPRGAAEDSVAAQDRLNPAAAQRTANGEKTLRSVGALRILIVDDHASVRKVFRGLLEERPEFVVVGDASNGLEAISQARALLPDVILMDISMPKMDGIEATRRLRAELPFIHILGLSSQIWPEPVHPIEEAGAAGYFVKGIDTQRLIDQMLSIRAALAVGVSSRPA
jgi:PAS domain S-box-containing protein